MQIVTRIFLSCALMVLVQSVYSGGIKTPAPQTGIRFTENKNQWHENILFRAQLDGGLLFLERNGFTYNFYDKETLRKNHLGKNPKKDPKVRTHAFKMNFVGSSPQVTSVASEPSPDYCNFFIGKDRNKWLGNIKNYEEVNYKDLYPGIGLQVLGQNNNIKYNFIVSSNADPNNIQLLYEGLSDISLKKGSLVLTTSINEMVEQKPYSYQIIDGVKVEVPCKFVLKNKTVSFHFPKGYNKAHELIIDPVLIFAASSGSTADNFGMTATYDSQGNLYSGGTAFDVGFPTTLGAYDTTFNGTPAYGKTDVVITKYNTNGTSLLYSTYLGGLTSTEIVTSLIVDAQDNLLLYGATGSSDFPVTATAYDQTFNGGILLRFINNGSFFDNGTDIYVAKFNSTGTTLLASTYIGGTMNDGVNVNNDSTFFSASYNPVTMTYYDSIFEFPADSLQYNYGDQFRGEIQVDASGNCYIASSTRSGNFPILAGFDNTLGGEQDAVLLKFNADLSTLLYSSYLGGSNNDAGYALIVNNASEVYITGGTRSNDFPTTIGSYKPAYGGGKADGFITHVNTTGSAILHSTHIGTADYDQSYFIQTDDVGEIYVFGQTMGAMPVINAPYFNNNAKQFVTKFDPTLSTIFFSTTVGKGGPQTDISPSAFLVDNCKNIYLSGWGGKIISPTTSTVGMPLTPDAIQPTTDGHNFYLMVLSSGASSLLYATYFGGVDSWEHVDGGTSRFDKKGIIYQSVCAGCQDNDDFPVTPGAWPYTSPNYTPYTPGVSSSGINMSTNCNNGTFKFDFQVPVADAVFTVDTSGGCVPFTLQLQNQSSPGADYLWDFGNGDTTSLIFNPVVTYTNPGTYNVQLMVKDPSRCNVWDTISQSIIVYPGITADFTFSSAACTNLFSFNDASFVGPVSWEWDFGDGDSSLVQNPTHAYDSVAIYNVGLITSTINGCMDTTVITVNYPGIAPTTVNSNDSICKGTNIQLNATGGFSYSWSPATGLNNPNIANPVAGPDTTTTYTVNIQTVNAINDTCLQTLSVTISVITDIAAFTSDTTNGCTPFTIQFQNENPSTSVYLWDFGNGNTSSTLFNPTQTYGTLGTYLVQLYSMDTASCATWDTVSQTITVFPGITADFDFVSVPCTDQFSFYDSSYIAPVSWLWNFDDGGTSINQNPSHLFDSAGTYNVELISSNTYGCRDTAEVMVSYSGATTTISSDDTICINSGGAQLNAYGGFAYSWTPTVTLSASNISNPVANPSITTTYSVNISTINTLGDTCIQTQSTTLTVIDPSLYSLYATTDSDTIFEGASTIIHAITDTNFTVNWAPASGLSSTNSFNPTASPLVTTTYTVSILDSTGCPRAATVTIYVTSTQCKSDNVFVPNTFTPNSDGENDILFVRSNDVTELYFAVYNRWGQMVFETTDITKGWNGIYKGMLADPAVFAWYLRAKCYNGDELTKKGNTTLIR
ncbi:MAG: repeat-containing protein [Bacteroidetes bacterium]|jgi:gliding motility-associated-like protein|nr:repeat-containing protein [Bacteroidota bacterium]